MKPDSLIFHDINNELKWEPDLVTKEISVRVHSGIVTLLGKVASAQQKTTAQKVAWRVLGVRGVANEIEVKLREAYERSDAEIALAAVNALKWNYSLPDDLKVTVDAGWVTLEGQIALEFLKAEAGEVVGALMGVRGVNNSITIKDTAQQDEVKAIIAKALKKKCDIDDSNIDVAVKGGHVILSGKVQNFSEIQIARRAAWNAPGVMLVENNLHMD